MSTGNEEATNFDDAARIENEQHRIENGLHKHCCGICDNAVKPGDYKEHKHICHHCKEEFN